MKLSRSKSPSSSTRMSSILIPLAGAKDRAVMTWQAPRLPSSNSTGFMPVSEPPRDFGSSMVTLNPLDSTSTAMPCCLLTTDLNVCTAICNSFPIISSLIIRYIRTYFIRKVLEFEIKSPDEGAFSFSRRGQGC